MLLAAWLALSLSGAPQVALKGKVTTVMIESGRWGGMAPRPGEEQARQKRNEAAAASPRPLPKSRFLVLAGRSNVALAPAAEFTTDEKGRFQLSLPPGDYCVIAANRARLNAEPGVRPGPPEYVDAACVEALAAACEVIWEVKEPSDVSFTLQSRSGGAPECWRGPSPP